MLIGDADDAAGTHAAGVQAHRERDRARFQVGGQQHPLANAVRLAARGAAKARDLDLLDAVTRDALAVLNVLDLLPAHLGQVVPRHQRHRIAGAQGRAHVAELAVHHVGRRVGIDRIGRHVRRREHRGIGPVRHASEDGREVLHHAVGVGGLLQIDVAGEARLLAAETVVDHLVAVAADLVQAPLVEPAGRHARAQAVAIIADQVVEDPGRVVGPGQLEGAVPDAAVAAQFRIVVGRHADDAAAHVIGARRDALELRGVDLDADHGRHGIAQLGVDDLGDAVDEGTVGDGVVVGIGRDAAQADAPALASARQLDAVRAHVALRGLAVERAGQHFLVAGAVHAQVDGVFDAIAVDVAVPGVGLAQPLHAQRDADGGCLQVGEQPRPVLRGLQLGADGDGVLGRRKAGQRLLQLGAGAKVDGRAAEIQRAVGVGDRRAVQVDVAQRVVHAMHRPVDLALAQQVDDAGIGRAVQAVAHFHGRARRRRPCRPCGRPGWARHEKSALGRLFPDALSLFHAWSSE